MVPMVARCDSKRSRNTTSEATNGVKLGGNVALPASPFYDPEQKFARGMRDKALSIRSPPLNLRWEWVDLDRGLLLLPDSKTGRKAIVLNGPVNDVALIAPAASPAKGSFTISVTPCLKKKSPRAAVLRPL